MQTTSGSDRRRKLSRTFGASRTQTARTAAIPTTKTGCSKACGIGSMSRVRDSECAKVLRKSERPLPRKADARLPPRRRNPEKERRAGREGAEREAPAERVARRPAPFPDSPAEEDDGHHCAGNVRIDQEDEKRRQEHISRASWRRNPSSQTECDEQTRCGEKSGQRVGAKLRRHFDQDRVVDEERRRQGRRKGSRELPGERRRGGRGEKPRAQRKELERNLLGSAQAHEAGQQRR